MHSVTFPKNHYNAFLKAVYRLSLLIVIVLISIPSSGQVINAYAKVTGISGNVLTVSNVNETNHTFTVGQDVIIMQMQDNVISGTNNDANFGGLGSIGSAGKYEVKMITAKTATTITLNTAPTFTYNTGANASVQVISFRLYGSPNYTTTGNMSALPWDGNIGGVVAFKVNGTLTLNNNVTASGAGFRGGAASTDDGTLECNNTYITSAGGISGQKGESIFSTTDANQAAGRAKILNGGGGGNRHNAGGGGGGNVTAGGDGGGGYNCAATPVGGIGGISLQSVISASRIFMGGGGGGGSQNNTLGTAGGAGGGIVLIKANRMVTTGMCANRNITADGASSSTSGNDGAGGAGAGGSIVLDINSYTVVGGCRVNVSASGGNGGSVNDAAAHGAGGGGGQGFVNYSVASPNNVTTTTNNGSSGCNNNSSPCNSQAAAPGGTNGSGINTNSGATPLPIQLKSFEVNYNNGKAMIEWTTLTEVNNDYFTLSRSADGVKFEPLFFVKGAGTTHNITSYHEVDSKPLHGKSYYQLMQTDFDKESEILGVRSFETEEMSDNEFGLVISPNPNHSRTFLVSAIDPAGVLEIEVMSSSGLRVMNRGICISRDEPIKVELPEETPAGLYLVKVITQERNYLTRVVLK